MEEELVHTIKINGEIIELPIPFSVDVIEEVLAMDEDSDESMWYKFKVLTAKVINVLCNQIRDLQQQVRPKAEWTPITTEMYSNENGSEMIAAEHECTRCDAAMANDSCCHPSKEEFADILKAIEDDEPQT